MVPNDPSSASAPPAAVKSTPWRTPALVAAVVFLLQIWLFHPLVADYFPTLDEIAMQAGSTDLGGPVSASSWLTQGLHEYFVPYPEWSAPPVDFWRPLANAWYWLCHQLFGAHWGYQLVLGYVGHALVAGLTCYIAISLLGLSPMAAAAAVAIAVFNPAYIFHSASDPFSIPRATQFPVYQIEVLTALLMVGSLLAFMRQRLLVFCLLATAAALLKETALLLPLAALAVVALWPKGPLHRARSAAWLALPAVVWLFGRLLAWLVGGATRVIDFPGLKVWIAKSLRNALLWPTGLYQDRVGVTRHALTAHEWLTVARDGAALLINLLWWVALIVAVIAGYRYWIRTRRTEPAPPWVIVLLFALANLVGVLLLPATELRYGYLWFALGPAALFAALSQRRRGGLAIPVLSICLLVPQLFSVAHSYAAAPLQAYRIAKQSARQLTALVGALPAGVQKVYLIDDLAVQSSSPKLFAKFSGFAGNIVLINNLAPVRGCTGRNETVSRYRLTGAGAVTTLDYEAPDCFVKAWNVAPLDQFDSGHFVQRGRAMRYQFPELSLKAPWFEGDRFDYDPGRHWMVRIQEPVCGQPGACVWIGLDPVARGYYVLGQ
jgi:hypothetical protein